MSVVRWSIQLDCETNRRQGAAMQFLLLLLGLLGLQGLGQLGVTAAPTQWIDTTLDECHDEYSLAAAKAGNIFAASYELCELTANETRIDLTVNEALERSQIEEGHSKLCGNLDMCDSLDDDLEYFACIRDRGNHNLDLITEINHNATSAHTRLRQDYNEVQQTLVLCTLEAQLVYVNSMREAHEELHQCRLELAGQDDGNGKAETETETGTEMEPPTN